MTYEIVIRNETSDQKSSPIAGDSATPQSQTAQGSTQGALGAKGLLVKGLVSFNQYIKPFVDKTATQYIATTHLATGAQELEERMSYTYSMVQKGAGFLTSTIVGFAVGNVPGALIGMSMSMITTGIDYIHKTKQLNMQRDLENTTLRLMNMRAGGSVASFSNSRLANQ